MIKFRPVSTKSRIAFLQVIQAAGGSLIGYQAVAPYRETAAAMSLEEVPMIEATTRGGWSVFITDAGRAALT